MKFPILAATLVLFAAGSARADAPKTISISIPQGGAIEMILVKAGTFTQGSKEGEKGREPDERAHAVTLTHDFYLAKYPVTRLQFAAFTATTSYRTEAEKGASGGSGWNGHELVQRKEFTWKSPGFSQTSDDPVTLVTYDDALAFAGWASQVSGRVIVLPTEAEWEYAARAGTTTPYAGGTKEDDALASGWFKKNAGNGTRPVGQKKPNAFGFYDMEGNVFEWCRDFYAPYPEGPLTDPLVEEAPAGETARRVLRGGSWLKDPVHGRSAARFRNTPGSRNADNGFRLATYDTTGPSTTPLPIPQPPRPDLHLPPPPDAYPTPVTPPAPPSSPGLGPIGLLAAGGIGAVLLYWFLRRRGGASAPAIGASGPGDVSVRVVADGFWLGPGLRVGTRVKYTCIVRGVPVTDTVTMDGGAQGTFVYTGGAPEDVRVLEVTTVDDDVPPPTGGGPMYRGAVVQSTPIVRDPDPDPAPPPPFGGFPPAY